MEQFRIGEAAAMLGVSADTVRRWVDSGRLAATRDPHGHRTVAGEDLAAFARRLATASGQSHPERGNPAGSPGRSSARNRFRGIVTAVIQDSVMAQVEIQAGPFRVVSLMSREALDDLDLRIGSPVCAVVKSTNVIVERP